MELSLSTESALDEWKSMRVQLSNSIYAYISACETLRAVCARDHQTRARAVAERAFILLDTELECLAAEESSLRSTLFSLSKLRNKSETLAPINLLPSEILIEIFKLSISNCSHSDRGDFPYNLVNTCTSWRQIVLEIPYFWTHIDVGPGVPWGLSKLMLERAKTNPLHLHIDEHEIPRWAHPKPDEAYRPDPLLRDLASILHRVHTLELSSDNLEGDFVGRMINLWLGHGDQDLVKRLSVYQQSGDEVIFDDYHEVIVVKQTSEHGKDVLLSLQILHLHGVRFNWDSNAYRGLVDLRLSFDRMSAIATISSLELVCILLASPMLAVLKLRGLEVTYTENIPHAIPISLDHLRILNLGDMRSDTLKHLLPLIGLPKTSSAELRIGLEIRGELEKELKAFLGQSPITTLYFLCRSNNFRAWSSTLAPLDSLRALILDMGACDLKDNAPPPANPNSQVTTGSRPLRLVLRRCCLSYADIHDLVSKLDIHELRIEDPGFVRNHGINQPAGEYWESIRAPLVHAHPTLQYIFDGRIPPHNKHSDISPGYWP
ncbi:hypothetical protein FRC09_005758 [Ceratobasidium sp. 395]|nr:hypothetical protein FRC09_005758 [Ceratobasidium sp. 395]